MLEFEFSCIIFLLTRHLLESASFCVAYLLISYFSNDENGNYSTLKFCETIKVSTKINFLYETSRFSSMKILCNNRKYQKLCKVIRKEIINCDLRMLVFVHNSENRQENMKSCKCIKKFDPPPIFWEHLMR